MKSFVSGIVFMLLFQTLCFPSYLEEADKLLQENKPEKALPLYEMALSEDPENERIFLDLALVYEMMKNIDKSIEILKRGLNIAHESKYLFYFHLGNNHYTLKKYSIALEMYKKALDLNPGLPDTYVNMANTKLKLALGLESRDEKIAAFGDIIRDYEKYLELYPKTPQRTEVEKMIALLSHYIRDKEDRERDLENLLKLLNSAEDSSKVIHAGTDTLESDYEEEDIED
ncbi:MAG: tetratricopeptide repeat protein [Spirochaetales bacterium]|nr:tetratricopeptide repeat protein [Spirochaetales bacterium]